MENSNPLAEDHSTDLAQSPAVPSQDKFFMFMHVLAILAAIIGTPVAIFLYEFDFTMLLPGAFVLASALCMLRPNSLYWWVGLLGAFLGIGLALWAQHLKINDLTFVGIMLYGSTAANFLHRKLVYQKSGNTRLSFSMALVLAYSLWLLFLSARMFYRLSTPTLLERLDTFLINLAFPILIALAIFFRKKIPVVLLLLAKAAFSLQNTYKQIINIIPLESLSYADPGLISYLRNNLLWIAVPVTLAFYMTFKKNMGLDVDMPPATQLASADTEQTPQASQVAAAPQQNASPPRAEVHPDASKILPVPAQDKVLKILHWLIIIAAIIGSFVFLAIGGWGILGLFITLPVGLFSAICLVPASSSFWWFGFLGSMGGFAMSILGIMNHIPTLPLIGVIVYGASATCYIHRNFIYKKSISQPQSPQRLPLAIVFLVAYTLWIVVAFFSVFFTVPLSVLANDILFLLVNTLFPICIGLGIFYRKRIPIVICMAVHVAMHSYRIAFIIMRNFPEETSIYYYLEELFRIISMILPSILLTAYSLVLTIYIATAKGLDPYFATAPKTPEDTDDQILPTDEDQD